MADSELMDDHLKYWAGLIEGRGHAGAFARKTDEDLAIVECQTANEWCKSVADKYGLMVDRVIRGPAFNLPPDCYAELDGRRISLELTEWVDGDFIRSNRDAESQALLPSAYHGDGFVRSQWNETRLRRELAKRLKSKDEKYQRGSTIDVLIIYTGEPWLDPYKVERWLAGPFFEQCKSIRSAYLLMTYRPGYSDNWPVYRLY